MNGPQCPVAELPDSELLDGLRALVTRSRQLDAQLLAYLGEVDARRLYLGSACSSMFAYCQQVLGFEEAVAYLRIKAARAARRYPRILAMIGEGTLTLTAVKLLDPHLTADSHEEILAQAARLSVREVELLVARLAPRPDVPPTVRKLPSGASPRPSSVRAAPLQPARPPTPQPPSAPAQPPRAKPPEPLAPDRFKVQFTASAEFTQKLSEVRELASHSHPDWELGDVLEEALNLLHASLLKKRFAVGARPKAQPTTERSAPKLLPEVPGHDEPASPDDSRPAPRSMPAATRRLVWERDGGQCTFVDDKGRRCKERRFLELDHIEPFARGGPSTPGNVRLLCAVHNQLAARRIFGEDFIRSRINAADHGHPP